MTAGARLVLDTSAYSNLRTGHSAVLDAIAAATIVYVPATVLGELDAAFRLGSREKENRQALAEFLEEPFVAVLPVTSETATWYGRVFTTLRRHGTPIPVNDVWIAASTLDAGATLLTFDQDFERIPDFRCVVLAV